MERISGKINLNNLDKSNWESFRFEEIAFRVTEGVDPNTTILEKYVGLEHIDAENIHIKRFGTPDDVSGGKLKCYPGDVIFGKRRAYQRKAAIVEFEGICSAHAFVFRANPEVIDSNLFPFFLHSDQFMNRAIDISVGGLSPTINWGDLKGQEFLIPPKTEQARLAELLWAMDEVIEMDKSVLAKLKRSDVCQLKHYFSDDLNSDRIKLKNIVSLKKGKKPDILNVAGEGLPYCTAKYLRTNEIEYFVPESTINKEFLTVDSDIIILWDGSNAGEMLRGKKGVLASTMCKLVLKDRAFNIDFIFQFLRFRSNDIRRATVGSAIPHVDPGMIENIEIPVLNIKNQESIVALFDNISYNINLLDSKILSTHTLQKKIISQIF
jgi:type I restriction enzyme S subunit